MTRVDRRPAPSPPSSRPPPKPPYRASTAASIFARRLRSACSRASRSDSGSARCGSGD